MTLPNTTNPGWQPWSYRDATWLDSSYDLTGYDIGATDGDIGKVDSATYETGSSYLVVETGPWIFGRKVMLPAGVVSSVDHQNRKVLVDRTMDQIKHAPEFDPAAVSDTTYRGTLSDYYREGGAGWGNEPR